MKLWSRSGRRQAVTLYLAVAAGSAIGGLARALVSLAALAAGGPAFPWGTLSANIAGSFAIVAFAGLTAPGGRLYVGTRTRQFVMSGFCGGFTTFSVFSLEALHFLVDGALTAAVTYVGVSVVAWLAAAWLGHALAERVNRLGGS